MEEKTVIVAGGCGLLGKEFVKTLRKVYYNVIILDLPEKINKSNLGFSGYGIDITDEKQVKDTIVYIYDTYGIDILINCVAINPIPKENTDNVFENYSLQKWNNTINVNLTGAFLLSRECIKYMLKNRNGGFKGTIVNIASDLGIIVPNQNIYDNGYIKPPDYSVSKAGLIQLTKYIASYYGSMIKSVALVPGSIYTTQSDNLKNNLEKLIPMGRLATVHEYNEAIEFLCSSGSDYMQGQSLIMDGGRCIL